MCHHAVSQGVTISKVGHKILCASFVDFVSFVVIS